MDLSSLGTWVLVGQIALLETLLLLNVIRFRVTVNTWLNGFKDPEARRALFSEIAHGVMKAASERSGAVRGAAARQAESALGADVSGLAISGLASFLPKKYQAFAPLIAPYIQQFLEKSPMMQQPANGGSSTAGLPP